MESLHEVYRCLPETYYAALPLGLNGGIDVVAGFGVPYVAWILQHAPHQGFGGCSVNTAIADRVAALKKKPTLVFLAVSALLM